MEVFIHRLRSSTVGFAEPGKTWRWCKQDGSFLD
jgi:hypothetical protein